MQGGAIVEIWKAEDVSPILKYEDDLKAFRCPSPTGTFFDSGYQYDYDRDSALQRIAHLDIPWHKEKGDLTFQFVTNFIGFRWDIPQKRVSLPDEKRLKFHNRVRIFLDRFDGHKCTLNDVEKIHGSLCHVAFVYIEGRSRLPSLSNFAASFHNNEFLHQHPPPSVLTDLRWWLRMLDVPDFYRELRPCKELEDLGLYVDASTSWGIGVIIGDRWAAFKLKDGWKTEGRDICWLETLALEFLVYFLEAMDIHDVNLLIHSDNQGAIGSVDKGRSRNHHINFSVRRIYTVLISRFITPHLIYITSEANPADPISRGELGPLAKRLPLSFSLPDELRDIFTYV